jgi:zinc protease
MKVVFYLFLLLLFSGILFAQQNISLNDSIPVDPKITTGELSNGLKYYIRENKKPEKRAFLRLVVNAGSILENEDQRGLAHLTEHMAFNGTKHFAKMDIVNYLESIGMRFGPDINAYTSFDETVYMIEVPTDTSKILRKGFQILEDWAHNLSFDSVEIDKERGVVIEEWRLGRGAQQRILDKQLPVLLKDSRYAERLPIGKVEILRNFKHPVLINFYKTWYRPDLMAVVAVGDFNKDSIETLIKKDFSNIKNPADEKKRDLYPVPDDDSTLFSIATDPEATSTEVELFYKLPVSPQGTVKDYRESLVEQLYNGMLNERFQELSQKPDPPFLYGFSAKDRIVRTKEAYILAAAVKDSGIDRGLETLLTEAKRVKEYGFTQSELDRQKQEMLRYIEKAYNERNKTESTSLASEYIRNFLEDEPIPGITYEYKLQKELLPGIKLSEVNDLGAKWMSKNEVVLVSAPQKNGLKIPDKEELENIIQKVKNEKITAYEDKVSNAPLIEKVPLPAKINGKKNIEDLGLTEWTLSNGIKVYLKPTDFKNDEILFQGFSPGGNSLVPDSEYIPAVTSAILVNQSGVGNFNETELEKKLAGKIVNVYPYISELSEGISGSSTPKDLKTMFELIHLYFKSPRLDTSAFLSYKAKLKSWLENRSADPNAAFSDTLQNVLSRYNYRREPWTLSKLKDLNLKESFEIYKNRFADASDFKFIFVGNFKADSIKPLIETYLGSLPSLNRNENWKDLNIEPPKGVVDKKVIKGIEPKSKVSITFTGPFNWSYENSYELNSMLEVLRIKLRELLREDKSGTYGVGVYGSGSKIPDKKYSVTITWSCAPERVNELVQDAFQEIDSLKTIPVTPIYITKVKETQIRENETNLKENRYWLGLLQKYLFENLDLSEINKYKDRVSNLSAKEIEDAAKEYLNMKNYVKVVLYPEKEEQSKKD